MCLSPMVRAALSLARKSDLGAKVGFWAAWGQTDTLGPRFTLTWNLSEELKLACDQFCAELAIEARSPGPWDHASVPEFVAMLDGHHQKLALSRWNLTTFSPSPSWHIQHHADVPHADMAACAWLCAWPCRLAGASALVNGGSLYRMRHCARVADGQEQQQLGDHVWSSRGLTPCSNAEMATWIYHVCAQDRS